MLRGMCFVLYTVKCTVGGDIWRGYVLHYIRYKPEGGFFRSIDFSFYLFNQFDWPKMTFTEFTFIDFTA